MLNVKADALFNAVLNWIYPQPCPVCNEIVQSEHEICGECRKSLTPITGEVCIKCGKSVELRGMKCEDCEGKPFCFERNISAFVYDPLLRRAIHGFKYSFNPYSAAVFGREMGMRLAQSEHSVFFAEYRNEFVVVSVPLHKARLKKRGYNQSEILAKEVAAALGMPFVKDCIIRTRDTTPQSEIKQIDEREENIKDAFSVERPDILKANNVLIVDDIYTTGATINELSRMIKSVSDKRIFAVTLAISSGRKYRDDDDWGNDKWSAVAGR